MPDYIRKIRQENLRAFTINDFQSFFDKSYEYSKSYIHQLMQEKLVVSPFKGFYVIVDPENQRRGCMPAEELVPILMKHLGANYYVSLLSAGLFFGASHQKPSRFQIISDKRIKKPLVFKNVAIDVIYKKSLLNLPTKEFTVRTGILKVATPELIAIDLLTYPDHSGGINHIATVLSELVDSIRITKLIQLARATGMEYQLQRIGYILEKINVINDENKQKILKKIADLVQKEKRDYRKLAPEKSSVGYSRCKKYRIIENTTVESDV